MNIKYYLLCILLFLKRLSYTHVHVMCVFYSNLCIIINSYLNLGPCLCPVKHNICVELIFLKRGTRLLIHKYLVTVNYTYIATMSILQCPCIHRKPQKREWLLNQLTCYFTKFVISKTMPIPIGWAGLGTAPLLPLKRRKRVGPNRIVDVAEGVVDVDNSKFSNLWC